MTNTKLSFGAQKKKREEMKRKMRVTDDTMCGKERKEKGLDRKTGRKIFSDWRI